MAREEIEFAVRDSMRKTLQDMLSSLDDVQKKVGEFNRSNATGISQVESAAHKTVASLRNLAFGFGGAERSASGLSKLLGAVGIAGSIVLLVKSLENLSHSSIRLHYTAQEMGMSTQEFSKLQQAYQRLGFSSEEASTKIAGTADKLRDLGARGPASEVYKQLANLGQGGHALAMELIGLVRSTGSTYGAFEALGSMMARLTPEQKRMLQSIIGVPERVGELGEALGKTTDQYIPNIEEMKKFNDASIDLQLNMENFKNKINSGLIQGLNELYKTLNERGAIDDLDKYIRGIDIEKIATSVENIAMAVEKIIRKLGEVAAWVNANWVHPPMVKGQGKEVGGEIPLPPPSPLRPQPQPPAFEPSEEVQQDINSGIKYMMLRRMMEQNQQPIVTRANYIREEGQQPFVTQASLGTAGVSLRELIDAESETNRILDDILDSLTGTGVGGAGSGGGGGDGGSTGYPAGQARRGILEGRRGGGGGGGSLPEGKAAENAQRIYNELRRLGHPHNQAAAALGHIQEESNFNPNATGDFGTAHGMLQHRGVRWSQYLEKSREWKLDPDSPEMVARFFDWEMRNSPNAGQGTRERYFGARSIQEAVTALNKYWRFRGWQQGQPRRYGAAERFGQEMAPGTTSFNQSESSQQKAPYNDVKPWPDTKPLDRVMSNELLGTTNVNVDVGSSVAKQRVGAVSNDVFLPVSMSGTPQMPIPYGIESSRQLYE